MPGLVAMVRHDDAGDIALRLTRAYAETDCFAVLVGGEGRDASSCIVNANVLSGPVMRGWLDSNASGYGQIKLEPGISCVDLKSALPSAAEVIIWDDATADVGRYLAGLMRPATGYALDVQPGNAGDNAIALAVSLKEDETGSEGYTLVVTGNGVAIRAATPTGVFYGVQTLRQLLPLEVEESRPPDGPVEWAVPCVTILPSLSM